MFKPYCDTCKRFLDRSEAVTHKHHLYEYCELMGSRGKYRGRT